jgi:hypothetical protein
MKIPKTFLSLAFVCCVAAPMLSQQCPSDLSQGNFVVLEVRTLEGRLIFHDGIRKWFELELDQPQCAESSIELFPSGDDWTPLQVLRGCRVRSKGAISVMMTGYSSLPKYQDVDHIESIGTCTPKRPFPDHSKARPDKQIRKYRVEMHIPEGSRDYPIVFRVSSAGKILHPWQAYASYDLTGGDILYGLCGKGFLIDKVFGPPEACPSHFVESKTRTSEDMAAFDLERAAAAGKNDLRLGYTCVRERQILKR